MKIFPAIWIQSTHGPGPEILGFGMTGGLGKPGSGGGEVFPPRLLEQGLEMGEVRRRVVKAG